MNPTLVHPRLQLVDATKTIAGMTPQQTQEWSAAVRRAVAKAKGVKEEELNGTQIPAEPEATYSRLAVDRNGFLSQPKGRGRLKRRNGPLSGVIREMFQKFFGQYIGEAFKKAAEAAKVAGDEIKPLNQELIKSAEEHATKEVEKHFRSRAFNKRKKARDRQKLSRRINRGLIHPRANRANCSGN